MGPSNWQNTGIFSCPYTVSESEELPLHDKLLSETARISWPELERLFAAGKVIKVGAELDLITVAEAMARDDASQVRQWMQSEQVGLLDDDSAQRWAAMSAKPSPLWAVVVNPWVLVQERATEA